MTKTDTEIMQYIARAAKDCRALYEVPMMVYAAIMHEMAAANLI